MKLTSIASISGVVAGLAAVGMGGYNLITTGCPLGTCSSSAVTTAVSAEDDHNCALGCGHEGHEAKTITAGAVSEKPAGACSGNAKVCTDGEVIAAGLVSEKKACDKADCDKSDKCCKQMDVAPEVQKEPA